MRPKNKDGSDWGPEATALAFEHLRGQCVAELRRRDEVRSDGKMNKGNHWAPYTSIPKGDKPDDGERYQMDPRCVMIHHSGADSRNLVRHRWAEFCKVPQDEKPILELHRERQRDAELCEMSEAGAGLAEEIDGGHTRSDLGNDVPGAQMIGGPAEGSAAEPTKPQPMPVAHPKPRDRGRPRKKAMSVA